MRYRLSHLLWIFILVACVVATGRYVYNRKFDFQLICTLNCPPHGTIDVYRKDKSLANWAQDFYYGVDSKNTVDLHLTRFSASHIDPQDLRLIHAKGSPYAAVVVSNSSAVSGVPQFDNGENWTRAIVAQSAVILHDFESVRSVKHRFLLSC